MMGGYFLCSFKPWREVYHILAADFKPLLAIIFGNICFTILVGPQIRLLK